MEGPASSKPIGDQSGFRKEQKEGQLLTGAGRRVMKVREKAEVYAVEFGILRMVGSSWRDLSRACDMI